MSSGNSREIKRKKVMTAHGQMVSERSLSPSTMLTVQELADLLHVHPNTLRIWNNRGLLRAFRLGPRGDRRFRWEDVASFWNSQGIALEFNDDTAAVTEMASRR